MIGFAQHFLNAGYSVVPLEYQSKKPLVKWSLYQEHQADTELVRHWFYGRTNLGIITGFNNLMVLDFDDFTEYTRWLTWIGKQPIYPLVQRAFAVRSSRGVHTYFRTMCPERNRHIDKIDIKGKFGLITGPGSVHASGAVYTPLHQDFFIPTIGALSDVLPAELLLSRQDVSPVIDPPTSMQSNSSDPWQSANQHTQLPGDDLVSAIRKTFKIEQFFKTPLTKTGGHFFMTQCPFHEDDTPSFRIDTRNEICGCFVCNFGKPLDVINFVALLYGINNRDAIFALAGKM